MGGKTPFHFPELAVRLARFLTLDDLDNCVLVCKQWHELFIDFTGRRLKTSLQVQDGEKRRGSDADELLRRLKSQLELVDGPTQTLVRSFEFSQDALEAFNVASLGCHHNILHYLPRPLLAETMRHLLSASQHFARICIRPYPGADWAFILQLIQRASKLKELIWDGYTAMFRDGFISEILRQPCGANLLRLEFKSTSGLTWDTLREIGELCPWLRDLVLHKRVKVGSVSRATVNTGARISVDESTNQYQHTLGRIFEVLDHQHPTAAIERRTRTLAPAATKLPNNVMDPYCYSRRPLFPALEHLEIHEPQPRMVANLLSHTPSLTSAILPLFLFGRLCTPVIEEAIVHDRCCQFLKSLTLVGWSPAEAADGSELDVLTAIHLTSALPLEHIAFQDARIGSQSLIEISRYHARTLKSLKISDIHRVSNRVIQGMLSRCPHLEELNIRPLSVGTGGCLLDLSQMVSKGSRPWLCRGLRVLHVPFRLPKLDSLHKLPTAAMCRGGKVKTTNNSDKVAMAESVRKPTMSTRSSTKLQAAVSDPPRPNAVVVDDSNTSASAPDMTPCICKDAKHACGECPLVLFFDRIRVLKQLQSITFYQDGRHPKPSMQRTRVANCKRKAKERMQSLKNKFSPTCTIHLLTWTKDGKSSDRLWPFPVDPYPCGAMVHSPPRC